MPRNTTATSTFIRLQIAMQRVKKHTSAPTKNCVSAANKFVPLILLLKCLVCITNTLRGLGSDLRPYHLKKISVHTNRAT